jgi:putative holliday junction resolvase
VRRGVRLGIDVGSVRIGVARCDPDGILATPVRTLTRCADRSDLDRISALVRECDALEVVIGLPTGLTGAEGSAASAVRSYAVGVAEAVRPVPVRLVDERFTTVSAHRSLREAGVAGRKQRRVVDQVAAVAILQSALDAERASGRIPGITVDLAEGADVPDPDDSARRDGSG